MEIKNNHQHQPFSLVEVLIVISIFAVLVSLLQPALKNAISHSENVSCMNHLKQIGVAHMLYSNDHDDFVVPAARPLTGPMTFGEGSDKLTPVSWDDDLSEYLGLALSDSEKEDNFLRLEDYPNYVKAFHCPADAEIEGEADGQGRVSIRRSYVMSGGRPDYGSSFRGMSGDSWSRRVSEAIVPGSTLLMTELDNRNNRYGKQRYASIENFSEQHLDGQIYLGWAKQLEGRSESFGLPEAGTGVYNYKFVDLHVKPLFYLDTIDFNRSDYGYFSIDPDDDPAP